MIKCAIVDDEPLAVKLLEAHIAKIPALQLVGKCQDAMEAFTLLQKQPVDLLFLDIQMPHLNGIQFLQSLSVKPKTIFTTAYREFAVEGFELEAVDYLLKPVTFERFFKAVGRVLKQQPLQQMPEQAADNDYIIFRSEGFQHRILLKDIRYIESQGNDIHVYLRVGATLVVKHAIGDLISQLAGRGFVRIHRSFIINARYVTAFNQSEMQLGERAIPVGRSYKENAEALISELSARR